MRQYHDMDRFALEAHACEMGMDKIVVTEFEDNDEGKDDLVQAVVDYKQGIVRKNSKPAAGGGGAGARARRSKPEPETIDLLDSDDE